MLLKWKEIFGLGLVAFGITGAAQVHIQGDRDAGKPLPDYSIAELTAKPVSALPDYIRLVGSTAQPQLGWLFTGGGANKDGNVFIYELPRTGPDWNKGEKVALLELDDEEIGVPVNPPGDVEGQLRSTKIPPGYGTAGYPYDLHETVPIFTLYRLPLHGVVPHTNGMREFWCLAYNLSFGGILLVWSITERGKIFTRRLGQLR